MQTWNFQQKKILSTTKLKKEISFVDWLTEDKNIVSVDKSGNVSIFEIGNGDLIQTFKTKSRPRQIALDSPTGTLNISFYRDDFSRIGLHPRVTPSTLPFEVENRTVILVDDVLYSGRTVRAALNEIFDYGRPSRVILAVLIEREGQELPIRADVVGHTLALKPTEQVKLHPDNLSLELHDSAGADT